MKTSEEDKKNMSKSAPALYLAMHLGKRSCQHLSSIHTPAGYLTRPVNEFGQKKGSNRAMGEIFSPTDLGTFRTTHHINLPEPACSENDPVLSIAQRVPSGILGNG